MKKIILYTIVFLFSGFLYGMEERSSLISYTYKTVPPISLIKDNIYGRKNSVPTSITVAGKTEQSVIEGSTFKQLVEGDVFKSKDNCLLLLDPTFKKLLYHTFRLPQDSMSIIVEGKKFDVSNCDDYIDREPIPGIVVLTIEPMLNGVDYTDKSYSYSPYKRIMRDKQPLICQEYYYGETALLEAEKGLGLCYHNLLEQAHLLFTEKDDSRSIAFPILSKLPGMPIDRAVKVAVASVINFIKDSINKDKYKAIQFVVEEKNDFDLYDKLLNEYINNFPTVRSK